MCACVQYQYSGDWGRTKLQTSLGYIVRVCKKKKKERERGKKKGGRE
jgi:hypothetical protein